MGPTTNRVSNQIGHHTSLGVTTKEHEDTRNLAAEFLPLRNTNEHEALRQNTQRRCLGSREEARSPWHNMTAMTISAMTRVIIGYQSVLLGVRIFIVKQ